MYATFAASRSEQNLHMSTHSKIHFPNLDALRFFAFLFVFISHCAVFITLNNVEWFSSIKHTYLIHGDLGVNFFFVLSGFLITFLLFTEKKVSAQISLKHFYIRRILRIWPLYFIILILGFLILPNPLFDVSKLLSSISLIAPYAEAPWYVFLLANIHLAYFTASSVVLAVLWSISIEEQFYLLWPLAVKKIGQKAIPLFLIAVIIATYVFRYIHVDEYSIVKYHTFSVFSDLAIGCLAGYYTFFSNKFKKLFTNLPRLIIALIYIILFVFIPTRNLLHNDFIKALEPVIFSLLFAGIILEQIYSEQSLFKVGKSKALTWLGKISYGLYCYHIIAMVIVFTIIAKINLIAELTIYSFVLTSILSLILTILIASLSYRFIEKPLLRIKERFGH